MTIRVLFFKQRAAAKTEKLSKFQAIFDQTQFFVRKSALLFLIFCIGKSIHAQYWQQHVNYTIDVSLNDKDHTLDGFEKLDYTNHSPDTLHFIWFHLWPNAYKNDKTAFSDQLLVNGNTKFYFSSKEQRGYINRIDFKVNGATATLEDHPRYIDVAKLILPSPLAPGQTVQIATPFHVQLPYNFSRGGHDGESYQITQWFPKPAVYDKNGWHPMPYLDQGEFYSEFGNFDVRITVPKNYVVAATGELQNADEKQWLLSRNTFSWQPTKEKIKTSGGSIKYIQKQFPPSSAETKTLRFLQNDVHDFAWFADKRFIVGYDTCRLSSGKVIDVYSFYTPQEKPVWEESAQFAKHAILFYSDEVGEYPYNTVNVVQGPSSFGGGMEYPTITVISPTNSPKELDVTIAHEIGHNWFYGILATNERDHPWMDEGINSFYEHRYSYKYYKQKPTQEKIAFESFAAEKIDQPIETTAEGFQVTNYDLVAYYKTSEWLRWMEKELGTAAFDEAMHAYFRDWQFKHPQPGDFRASLEHSTGKDLGVFFSGILRKGLLPTQERSGVKFAGIFDPRSLKNFFDNSYKNIITVGPAIGVNSYDQLMIGALITNVKLPLNAFKFFAAPMYGTGSKKFTGIGKIDQSFYTTGLVRKVDLFFNASSFSTNQFTDTAGKKHFTGFTKFVPGMRLTFSSNNPKSTMTKYVQWKTYLVNEDGLRFSRDTLVSGIDTSIVTRIGNQKTNRALNELEFVVDNVRALYPYRGEFKVEQSSGFVRTTFTGNYFFNYAKEGGLNVRLFAGKFFYTGSKTFLTQFATDRYHLNMTGPDGYEDYSYRDYFFGRNEFEGLESQQIMIRDGGFKIRTELLANKIGKTDDWLIATNLTSGIPSGLNPLSLLPVKIPLKVFLDIGTYAEAWKQNAEGDRFLFDGGFQLSLFKNIVNIYLPLIYSSVYKDYVKSTLEKKGRLLKTVSFSIDLSGLSIRNFDRNFPF
jgi:hypothetical protein